MLTEGGDPCGNGRGRRTLWGPERDETRMCVFPLFFCHRPSVCLHLSSVTFQSDSLSVWLSISIAHPSPSPPSLCLLMAAEFRKLVRLLETKSSEISNLCKLWRTHRDTHTRPPLKVMSQIECSLLLKINQSSINGDGVCVCVCVCVSVCV